MIDSAKPSDAAAGPEHGPDQRIDVRAQQLAGVYAKAFLGAAEKSGHLAERVGEFDTLVKQVIEPFPQF
jgi:hypothetical protein